MKKNWKTWLCSVLVVGATLVIGLFAGCTADDLKGKIDKALCEHNYGVDPTDVKTATCAEEGEELWTCIECGKEKTVVLEKAEHTVVNWVPKQKPTCRDEGIEEGKCSSCKTTITKSIEKLSHKEVKVNEKLPTCTVAGYTEYTYCSVCNDFIMPKVMIPALGHDVVVDKGEAATCTDTGLTDGKYCQREGCGEVLVEQKDIPALGHKIEYLAPVEATCETTGLTAGYACSRCDKVYTAQNVVEKLPHVDEDKDGYCDECFTFFAEPLSSSRGLRSGRYLIDVSNASKDAELMFIHGQTGHALNFSYNSVKSAGVVTDSLGMITVSIKGQFIELVFVSGAQNNNVTIDSMDLFYNSDTSSMPDPIVYKVG